MNREREKLARLALFSADDNEWASALERAGGPLEKLRAYVDADSHDWLRLDRAELIGSSNYVWPWELDVREQTAGPLLGLSPEDAVIESFRAFYFGLEWLRACSIVRISRTAQSRVMVSLAHDGFAAGLNQWRRGQSLGLAELTTRLVASKGQTFSWPARLEDSSAGRLIHSNLRIQHSEINGAVVDTTFVNCDFRGTLFHGCTFDGVTFVNCILDDVQFARCSVVGEPAHAPDPPGHEKSLPGYIVRASVSHARSIAWFRGGSLCDSFLYSATAGLPAMAVEQPQNAELAALIPADGRGLALLGGRISSLKFRSCSFAEAGQILVSQAAGTSVEFADQEMLRLRCEKVTLRGLTITTPLEHLDVLHKPTEDQNSFQLEFDNSLLTNLWFSPEMAGHASFANCLVWQLFNAGDGRLKIGFDAKSGFVGLINVAVENLPMAAPSQVTLGTMAERVAFARNKIDYRAHPTSDEVQELLLTIDRVSPSFLRTRLPTQA